MGIARYEVKMRSTRFFNDQLFNNLFRKFGAHLLIDFAIVDDGVLSPNVGNIDGHDL